MSETMGRCRSEMTAAYGARGFKPNDSDLVTADAIDRLAADVAAIEAKVNDIMPEDVRHFVESEKAWVALVTEQRDAAIRERNAARAEVERLRAIVHSDAGHMAKILIENERLRAGPAAPKPAGQGISPGLPGTQPPRNAAPPAGWLTDEERRALSRAFDLLCDDDGDSPLAGTVQAVLARAGSPPVVEVPPFENYAPYVLHLRYRDAISRAGVKWKEVGRE